MFKHISGPNITFSTAKHSFYEQYNGFRVGGSKITINTLLAAGYNHRIKNDILKSISVLAETGYNFSGYIRPTMVILVMKEEYSFS